MKLQIRPERGHGQAHRSTQRARQSAAQHCGVITVTDAPPAVPYFEQVDSGRTQGLDSDRIQTEHQPRSDEGEDLLKPAGNVSLRTASANALHAVPHERIGG